MFRCNDDDRRWWRVRYTDEDWEELTRTELELLVGAIIGYPAGA